MPFPWPFPAPLVMSNPSIVMFWLVPVIVNPGTLTVWPGVAARVTPGEAGATPLSVIADQLPEFRQITEPGEAADAAFWTFAPALSVCVHETPAGVGAPTRVEPPPLEPLVTAAVAAELADPDPPALAAVTAERIVLPTSLDWSV
jgi:hypothetical protein